MDQGTEIVQVKLPEEIGLRLRNVGLELVVDLTEKQGRRHHPAI